MNSSTDKETLDRWVYAIRKNDTPIISNLLTELDCSLLLQETGFGDTILTFAASLGRVEIHRYLIRKIRSHVIHNHNLVVSDYVNHETCRGKTPLVEAVKNNHAAIVSLLLSNGANAILPTKMHNKSALSWAAAMGHDSIVKLINNHIDLECRVFMLFKAVSTGDESKVKELIDGGAPNLYDQDEKYAQELELKCPVIFQSTEGHQKEHELTIEESAERDLLEANRIQSEVIVSRSIILKQEYDDTSSSVQTTSKFISQLRRKIEVSRLMNHVDGGHTILSWAAALGNKKVVKLLLKHGGQASLGNDCLEHCAAIIQVVFRRSRVVKQSERPPEGRLTREKDLAVSLRIKSLSNLIRERLLTTRLPFAEALVNGHSKVALILLDGSESQALNLFPLYCPPRGMIPRSSFKYHSSSLSGSSDLLSYIVSAGNMNSYEADFKECKLVDALQVAVNLTENCLKKRRAIMEIKLVTRRDTLMKKHKKAMISILTSSINNGQYDAMVQASEQGNISLDYEDENTGMTPLIRAAMEDIHLPIHKWCINSIGERVTAVAFLLDRISPYRPKVDYENQLGLTALGMACMHERVEVIVDLIDRGADIDRKSCRDGRTPFMLACLEGKVESVKVLLRYNSDGIKNGLDEAYALAVKEKQIDVVYYLDQLK